MQPPPPPGLPRERRQRGPTDSSGSRGGSSPSGAAGAADGSSKGKRPYWRNKNKADTDNEEHIHGGQPPPPPPPSYMKQRHHSTQPEGTPGGGRHGLGGRGRSNDSHGGFVPAAGRYASSSPPPSGFFPGSPLSPAFTPPPAPPPGLPGSGRGRSGAGRGRGGSMPQAVPQRHRQQQQQQRSSGGGPSYAYSNPPSQNSSQNGGVASTMSKTRRSGQPRYPDHVSGTLLQVGWAWGVQLRMRLLGGRRGKSALAQLMHERPPIARLQYARWQALSANKPGACARTRSGQPRTNSLPCARSRPARCSKASSRALTSGVCCA